MESALRALHLLGAVLWVGGMAFALMVLRPSLAVLAPPQRLALLGQVFARFFRIVWHAVPLILLTGYGMVFGIYNGFGGEFAVDGRASLELAKCSSARMDKQLKPELITRNDRSSESRVVDGHEVDDFLVAIRNFMQKQHTPRLCHGFDDQYTGHDRFAREVSLKIALVCCDVLDSYDPLLWFHFFNRIYQ
jgi:hypothetical protein